MPNPILGEAVLNVGDDAEVKKAFVSGDPAVARATDPVMQPAAYVAPVDFAGQYPQPLDPTEILDLCEEINLYRAIPEQRTSLNAETWRELSLLTMISGTTAAQQYIAFADGYCPEEYTHTGSNQTVYHKNIGAKKNLSIRDIMHSTAVAAANWHGINTLVGGFPASEGIPGGADWGTFQREHVLGVKEKEVRLAMTLVVNAWDRLLVKGDTATNALEFDGIEQYSTNQSCTFHNNTGQGSATGSFSAITFDRFLSETCAKPTMIFGSPQAIQEMLSAYFQLGFAGSQVINYTDGGRITPGFNFAGFVNTGIGRLGVVADNNFNRTDTGGGTFSAALWALRMTHNGEPLVYKSTQVPLSLNDLTPGCTAISFEIWAATALIIKACCAQSKFTSLFTGRIVATCSTIG